MFYPVLYVTLHLYLIFIVFLILTIIIPLWKYYFFYFHWNIPNRLQTYTCPDTLQKKNSNLLFSSHDRRPEFGTNNVIG